MKRSLVAAAVLAAGMLTASVGTSEAAQGCGIGFHRGYYGYCRPNGWYGPGWHRYGWGHPWGWRGGWGWHRGWGWHHRW